MAIITPPASTDGESCRASWTTLAVVLRGPVTTATWRSTLVQTGAWEGQLGERFHGTDAVWQAALRRRQRPPAPPTSTPAPRGWPRWRGRPAARPGTFGGSGAGRFCRSASWAARGP